MDLNEFKEEVKTRVEEDDDDGFIDGEQEYNEQMITDLRSSMGLIKSAKVLLDYLADPVLIKVISNRERKSIDRLSESMRQHLVELDATYFNVAEDL